MTARLLTASALVLVACAAWAGPALAAQTGSGDPSGPSQVPQAGEAGEAPRWTVQLEVGAALFTNSKSRTFQHLARTTVRLEATVRIAERLSLGAEFAAVPSGHTGYLVLAGYLLAKVPLVEVGLFGLDLGWGVGLGTGAPILSNDLRVERDVVPYIQFSAAARFEVTSWLLLGAELIYEQLTVVALVATVGGRF